jgi:Uma2 family endonuclease
MSAYPAESQERRLTVDEYEALPEEEEYRVELVRGRLVREPAPGWAHGRASTRIGTLLELHAAAHGLGAVLTNTRFVLSRNPATVRIPDVSFVAADRAPAPDYPGALEGGPDLAVEILSPSNTASEMQEKLADYFAAGVRAVWIVDPRTRTVAVYRPGQPFRPLGEDDELDGGEVVPGFSAAMSELFR